MTRTVQSCGSRQAKHPSCLGFSDQSDIFQTDTAVPEQLENWNSFITVLIFVVIFHFLLGEMKLIGLLFFFFVTEL